VRETSMASRQTDAGRPHTTNLSAQCKPPVSEQTGAKSRPPLEPRLTYYRALKRCRLLVVWDAVYVASQQLPLPLISCTVAEGYPLIGNSGTFRFPPCPCVASRVWPVLPAFKCMWVIPAAAAARSPYAKRWRRGCPLQHAFLPPQIPPAGTNAALRRAGPLP